MEEKEVLDTNENNNVSEQPQSSMNNNTNMQGDMNNIPDNYKPISMWGYFGYEILFSIPCVGFILLLVFSFGGTQNVNLKNFARSYFCFIIVFAIIVAIVVSVIGAGVIAGITGSSANI